VFYRAFNALSERPIPRDFGDFHLMDREVVRVITQLGGEYLGRIHKEVHQRPFCIMRSENKSENAEA
jgi:hypothetical protein